MKLVGLKPASALTVDAATPAVQCIERMANRQVGSVLIMGGAGGSELQGIFTERDVLVHFKRLMAPGGAEVPVGLVMTRELVTLPLSRIHESARLMVAKHIRHVVITYDDDSAKDQVAGLVSIRDLFGQIVGRLEHDIEPLAALPKKVLLVSRSDDSRRLLRGLLKGFEGVSFHVADDPDERAARGPAGEDCVFIDLERFQPREWAEYLRRLLAQERRPRQIVAIFNPQAHDHRTIDVLAAISQSGLLAILEKPLSVTDVLEILRG